ncbi:MAG: HPP family protein [Nitrosomonadales bacterium]|nr:HPP family protein [Nitrosomonadales bacterium]
MELKEFIASFKPGFDAIPLAEKIRSSFAVAVGILLMGWVLRFLPGAGYPLLLLASMAASAALLFVAPHSPMTQPWPLVGGHLFSALAGWGGSLLIPDPVIAGAVAVGLSVLIMYLLHCLHPSGAATALIIVLNAEQFHQHGWQWVAVTVTANALLSLLLALLINSLIPGRHYPARHTVRAPIQRNGEIGAADIEWALKQMDSVIDVSEADLLEIYQLADEHAKARHA